MTRRKINLESSADTEDAVVGLLGGKTLDGSLDGVVLFGDQVVEPDAVSRRCSIHVQRYQICPDKRRPGKTRKQMDDHHIACKAFPFNNACPDPLLVP